MTEIASLNARTRTADGARLAAVFTSVDGVTADNKPAAFRQLTEAERRVNCADGLAAIGFLAGVIAAEGWQVA